jgi:CspA family cold shock protein
LIGRQIRRKLTLKGMQAMSIGTVKFFDADRGFGFIRPEDGSADVFVHATAVERAGLGSITEGQRLSFDAVMDPRKGKTAADNLRAA